jgi:hypothetical protein
MRQEQRDYGVVRAASGDERGLLLVMQVPEGVYFGVTLPGPLKEPKLTLGLLCRYALVLEDAAVCTLVVDETGLAGARRTKGGRSLPWESGAQAAMNQSDGNCQTEIFVPYEGLDMPQGPEEGERWRVSCFLKEKGRGGAARTAAVWGAGAHELARHGAILAFSAAR